MNLRKLSTALGLVVALAGASGAAILPYPERVMKYQPSSPTWDLYLQNHWTDWKARFGNNGYILGMTPSGQLSQISEAQSYGLLMAAWFNDEAFFMSTWQQTTSRFQFGTHFSWKPGSDEGFAGDADQDIVGALIFASALQDSGYWKSKTYNWKSLAQTWMGNIAGYILNSDNTIKVYRGKDKELQNLSYALFHWYPVFKDFCSKNGMTNCPNWDAVRTASYKLLNANDPSNYGIVSNWCNQDGGGASSGTQSMPNDADMGFDAIRVPWRVGLDILWNHNTAAITYANNVWKNGKIDPLQAGMYSYGSKQIRGWGDPNNNYDGAEYEKFMTRAMWGALAVPLGTAANTQAAAAADALLNKGSFGTWYQKLKAWNYFADCCTDTTAANGLNNARKIYFAQSLGIMGSLAMSGRAWNIYDDLMNKWTAPDTTTKVLTPLAGTPSSIVAGTETTVITAKLSKSITWKLTLTGVTSKKVLTVTGTGSDISYSWKGTGGIPATTQWGIEDVNVELTGAWATTPATAKTVITLKKGSSVLNRGRISALSWTSQGLLVQEGTLSAGISYEAREVNIQGATLATYPAVSAQLVDGGIRLAIPKQATGLGLHFLDVRGSDGSFESILLPLSK